MAGAPIIVACADASDDEEDNLDMLPGLPGLFVGFMMVFLSSAQHKARCCRERLGE